MTNSVDRNWPDRRRGLRPALDFEWTGGWWRALSQRAALWLARRWLVVADLHLGKAATFRARGVPVPRGTTQANLDRLAQLVAALRPQRLVFVGDLLHARETHSAAAMQRFADWRARRPDLPMTLVLGNHDRAAGALPPLLDIDVVEEPWRVDDLAFCHHPQTAAGAAVVAGHLHPCVRLVGAANDSLRLPCFWQRPGMLVLPAFGEFTGGAPIAREPGDRVLAVADDGLIEIPGN